MKKKMFTDVNRYQNSCNPDIGSLFPIPRDSNGIGCLLFLRLNLQNYNIHQDKVNVFSYKIFLNFFTFPRIVTRNKNNMVRGVENIMLYKISIKMRKKHFKKVRLFLKLS